MSDLTPPDRARCQAMVPTGNSFLRFGGRPGLARCWSAPHVIMEERKPGEDGKQGSMSLCLSCLQVMSTQSGGTVWKRTFIKEVLELTKEGTKPPRES